MLSSPLLQRLHMTLISSNMMTWRALFDPSLFCSPCEERWWFSVSRALSTNLSCHQCFATAAGYSTNPIISPIRMWGDISCVKYKARMARVNPPPSMIPHHQTDRSHGGTCSCSRNVSTTYQPIRLPVANTVKSNFMIVIKQCMSQGLLVFTLLSQELWITARRGLSGARREGLREEHG